MSEVEESYVRGKSYKSLIFKNEFLQVFECKTEYLYCIINHFMYNAGETLQNQKMFLLELRTAQTSQNHSVSSRDVLRGFYQRSAVLILKYSRLR